MTQRDPVRRKALGVSACPKHDRKQNYTEIMEGMDLSDFMKFSTDAVEAVSVSTEELRAKLEDSIRRILRARFPNDSLKATLPPSTRSGRMNIACPVCGDSKHNSREKRGIIHLDTMTYKCWNGGCPQNWMRMETFLQKFGELQNFTDAELNAIRRKSSEMTENSGARAAQSANVTQVSGLGKYAIPRDDIMREMRLVEVDSCYEAREYLKGRKQLSRDNRHFAWKRSTGDLHMLNLSQDREGVIGVQIRRSNPKGKQRFFTMNYERLWDDLFGVDNLNEEIKVKVNRASMIYNILGVNYSEEIWVFESTIDSHHVPNSLATWGTGTRIYLPNGVYAFDNSAIDRAGRVAATEMLALEHRCFLWKRFSDEYPHLSGCKDFNDIFKKQEFTRDELRKYTGSDPLDAFWL